MRFTEDDSWRHYAFFCSTRARHPEQDPLSIEAAALAWCRNEFGPACDGVWWRTADYGRYWIHIIDPDHALLFKVRWV